MVETSTMLVKEAVTCAARSEWLTCRLCASCEVTIEIPTDEPTERDRLSKLDPSVRSIGGKVAKALALSGMNTSPMPIPCRNPDVAMW